MRDVEIWTRLTWFVFHNAPSYFAIRGLLMESNLETLHILIDYVQ